MPKEKKTFKVLCAHCRKPFHVRYPLATARGGAEGDEAAPGAGTAEVVVTCLYCKEDVIIALPREYVSRETLLRSLPRG
jgi:hypothetical protein